MKLLSLRLLPDNGRSLKAFADIELDDGIEILDLRVEQLPGRRPRVVSPQTSFKDPSTGKIIFKTIVLFPDGTAGEIERLVLNEWSRVKERSNEVQPPR